MAVAKARAFLLLALACTSHAQELKSDFGTGNALGLFPFDFNFSFPGIGSVNLALDDPVFDGELEEIVASVQQKVADKVKSGDVSGKIEIPEAVKIAIKTQIGMKNDRDPDKDIDAQILMNLDLENITATIKERVNSTDPCEIVEVLVDVGKNSPTLKCEGCPEDSLRSQTLGLDSSHVLNITQWQGLASELAGKEAGAAYLADAIEKGESMHWGDCDDTLSPTAVPLTDEEAVNETMEYADDRRRGGDKLFQPDSDGFISIWTILVLSMLFGIILSIWCCGCCACCCKRCGGSEADETEIETKLYNQFGSLIQHHTLPMYARLGFFAVVALNTAFFLMANLDVGATINVDLYVAGEFVKLPSIYDFSIAASTIEMLKAGIIFLGILLLGFSVIWPYVKLIMLSFIWVAPVKCCRPRTRACYISWIDVLGKWSMFDVFALCVCLVIFNVNILTPANRFWPLGYYGLSLSLITQWGMYSNLIAQIISQLLSTYVMWAQRRAFKSDWTEFYQKSTDAEKGEEMKCLTTDADKGTEKHVEPIPSGALMNSEFDSQEGGTIKITLCGKIFVIAVMCASLLFTVLGFFLVGFTVRVVGIFGLIQEAAIPGSSIRYFSPRIVASEMLRLLPEDVGAGIYFGTGCISAIFVISTLLVPFAQASVLLALFTLDLSHATKKRMLLANEQLGAWQYLEVYIFAVLVATIQIPIVCTMLIGDSCDPIQGNLNQMVEDGKMDYATCFGMVPVVTDGLWYNLFVGILLATSNFVVRDLATFKVNSLDPLRRQQQRVYTEDQKRYFHKRILGLIMFNMARWVAEPPKEREETPAKEIQKSDSASPEVKETLNEPDEKANVAEVPENPNPVVAAA